MATKILAETQPFSDLYALLGNDKCVSGDKLKSTQTFAFAIINNKNNFDYVKYRAESEWSPKCIDSRQFAVNFQDFGRLYLVRAYRLSLSRSQDAKSTSIIKKIDDQIAGNSEDEKRCISLIDSDLLNASYALNGTHKEQIAAKQQNKYDIKELPLEKQIECLSIKCFNVYSPEKLSKSAESKSWVALYNPEADAVAKVVPLALTLFHITNDDKSQLKELTVTLCPSLLTSLDWFMEPIVNKVDTQQVQQEEKEQIGWWTTLDHARKWAINYYKECADNDPLANGQLSGEHIVRWDLDQGLTRPLSEVRISEADEKLRNKYLEDVKNEYHAEVEGTSHGAAFAACLVQALARAHLEGNTPLIPRSESNDSAEIAQTVHAVR